MPSPTRRGPIPHVAWNTKRRRSVSGKVTQSWEYEQAGWRLKVYYDPLPFERGKNHWVGYGYDPQGRLFASYRFPNPRTVKAYLVRAYLDAQENRGESMQVSAEFKRVLEAEVRRLEQLYSVQKMTALQTELSQAMSLLGQVADTAGEAKGHLATASRLDNRGYGGNALTNAVRLAGMIAGDAAGGENLVMRVLQQLKSQRRR